MGEFGQKFRAAREKKELSLDDVSNVTKISTRMLKAIEEEHFDQLPGGVFNKGFIRAYAKHLGLDAEEAVTDYLACLRQAQVDAHEVWEPEPASPPEKRPPDSHKPFVKHQPPVGVEELPELQLPRAEDVRPPRRSYPGSRPEIPWKVVAASGLVILLIVILMVRHSHRTPVATAKPVAPVTAAAAAPTAPSPQPSTTPPASSTTAPPKTAAPTPQPVESQAAPPPHPIAPPTPASDTEETSDVTIRHFDKPAAKPSAKPALSAFTLIIRASENSWVSVVADGQLVTQETLIAPAATSVHATRQVTVRIGNAAGISFLLNGTEIAPQGTEAEVKTLIFDSSGMKTAPN